LLNALRVLPILLVCCLQPALASNAIDLDRDWQFRTDPQQQGETLGWNRAMPTGTASVRVPHTWNIGPNDDFEGIAWYFRRYVPAPGTKGQHVELHFGATFDQSKVWLNGNLLSTHSGGFTEYWFDITPRLKSGENLIVVQLDNRPTAETIPGVAFRGGRLWYDWWHYGGIVRDVWLAVSDNNFIRTQKITSQLSPQSATVLSQVVAENHSKTSGKLSLQAVAYAPDGSVSGHSDTVAVKLSAGAAQTVPLTVAIDKPQLWGIDHPRIYRMVVNMTDGTGGLIDTKTDTFGLRTIEIKDRHLYLNGERVRLTGMARHEESPWEGLAETTGTIKHDYDELKQLHVTFSRPVHYPQNQQVLDYADEHGILLIPEIPIWQFAPQQFGDPKVVALAQQMMKELIEQDQNHPSIWAWSLCNESAVASPEGHAYVKLMKHFVNTLDPGRYVSYASDAMAIHPDAGTEATEDIDFIMLNDYWGTFHGPEENVAPYLDKIGRNNPTKMVVVSEFGAPGNFAGDTVAGDQLRVRIMKTQMEEFAKRDWIGGAIFWSYADYKSHRGIWPGYTEGYDDIGVEDENRQRRPSFFVWQKINEPVLMQATWKKNQGQNTVGFELRVARKPIESLPSYPLRDYVAMWELRDRDGTLVQHGQQALPDLEQPQTILADWSAQQDSAKDTLTVKILDPQGEVAGQMSMDAIQGVFGGEPVPESK
jgi:beta-galactosidase/beta-glucuronidase